MQLASQLASPTQRRLVQGRLRPGREVMRRFPLVRVVLATGYSVADDDARRAGLTVLQKPCASRDLMQVLHGD